MTIPSPKFKVGDIVIWDNPAYSNSNNYMKQLVVKRVEKVTTSGKNASPYSIYLEYDYNLTGKVDIAYREDCFSHVTKLHKALM